MNKVDTVYVNYGILLNVRISNALKRIYSLRFTLMPYKIIGTISSRYTLLPTKNEKLISGQVIIINLVHMQSPRICMQRS